MAKNYLTANDRFSYMYHIYLSLPIFKLIMLIRLYISNEIKLGYKNRYEQL